MSLKSLTSAAVIALMLSPATIGLAAPRDTGVTMLPTGATLSPVAAPGARLTNLDVVMPNGRRVYLDHPAAIVPGPDGSRLFVLTSGFNRQAGADGKMDPAMSTEWLMTFDMTGGTPVRTGAQRIPNTFGGLAISPDGAHMLVSGGSDDVVHVLRIGNAGVEPDGAPIKLGHKEGLGIAMKPQAGAVAWSPDGRRALVANFFNDSVSLIDPTERSVIAELDLRPGKIDARAAGVAGGEYPVDVLWTDASSAYVLSLRDREIIALSVTGDKISVTGRTALPGQPARMTADKPRNRIYVAVDTADLVAAIDMKSLKLLATLPVRLPNMPKEAHGQLGTGLNNLLLSRDGRHLWVTLGALNAAAKIRIGDDDGDDDEIGTVEGMIPVGWYPTAVAEMPGGQMVVSHAKSVPGPNPGACRSSLKPVDLAPDCTANNQYMLQLEHGGLVSFPGPSPQNLKLLSAKVAANNNLAPPKDHAANAALMKALSKRIKHVIYVVKENRTYDQIFGALKTGDGDPKLALLAPFAPNHQRIAQSFVLMDRAFASGEVSNTGWMWSTAGRTTSSLEATSPVAYAARGLDYGAEGMNRNVNTGLGKSDLRRKWNPLTPDDVDLLPGTADTSAPDARLGEGGTGFLWDSVLRAGLTVRNYGFFVDDQIYVRDKPGYLPAPHHPFAEKAIQSIATRKELADLTDPYFRSFDQSIPDYWRFLEWKREFDIAQERGELPNLSLVRFSHDHFGAFDIAEDGVNTIETQMADNDYVLGLLVEHVAHSRFKDDTLILVIEDDAQNGADHVDARRTVVLAAGPYVRQGAVVSNHFTTVSLLRTITDVLGTEPVGLQAALAEPMAAIFDLKQKSWDYSAVVPEILYTTKLPLPGGKRADGKACPVRNAAYWSQAMKSQNFDGADQLDSTPFNRALEQGLAPVIDNPACATMATR